MKVPNPANHLCTCRAVSGDSGVPAAEFRDMLAASHSLISLPGNSGRTKSLTPMFISQPCWDPGNPWMDLLWADVWWAIIQQLSVTVSWTDEWNQSFGHQWKTAYVFSLLPDCAADAIRHQCRELNQPKAERSMQEESVPRPSQQVHLCQHQGSRKGGEEGRQERRGAAGPDSWWQIGKIQLQHHTPNQGGAEEMSGCV